MKLFRKIYNFIRWYTYWRYEYRRIKADPYYYYLKYWGAIDNETGRFIKPIKRDITKSLLKEGQFAYYTSRRYDMRRRRDIAIIETVFNASDKIIKKFEAPKWNKPNEYRSKELGKEDEQP